MTLFRNVVFIAAIAGLVAGIALAAMQAFATWPLILQAEAYESAGGGHHHAAAPAEGAAMSMTPADKAMTPAPAAEGEEAWAPANGIERHVSNGLFDIATGIGFALILVAFSEIVGGIGGWRQGVFWGLAGFAVFTLAPGLGLPPELPAMPAADLMQRQIWWVMTVVATAAGLALIAFRGTLPLAIVGVALIVAPHLIGAPLPASFESPVPEALHHQFVVAVTITNLVFWLVLGAVIGLVRERFNAPQPKLSGNFA